MVVVYVLTYAVFGGFFILELFCRRGKGVKNMRRTKFDKGSTSIISVALSIAFVIIPLAPIANRLGVCNVSSAALGIAGLALGAAGLAIRYLAFATMGRFFSRTLREADNHTLVTNGIYRYARHPGYLSNMLIFVGTAMAMGNLIPIIIVPLALIPAYVYRIKVEEEMLVGIFGGDYREYSKKTKKIIPYIY